jgi:hypothetical protein
MEYLFVSTLTKSLLHYLLLKADSYSVVGKSLACMELSISLSCLQEYVIGHFWISCVQSTPNINPLKTKINLNYI